MMVIHGGGGGTDINILSLLLSRVLKLSTSIVITIYTHTLHKHTFIYTRPRRRLVKKCFVNINFNVYLVIKCSW